jgi:hypothetical protein
MRDRCNFIFCGTGEAGSASERVTRLDLGGYDRSRFFGSSLAANREGTPNKLYDLVEDFHCI